MSLDPETLADAVAEAIEKATQPLYARIALLEQKGPRDGRDGLPGVPGPQGEKGITGDRGVEGAQGLPGSAGPQGDAGPQGERGESGIVGPEGKQGPIGERGQKGDPGRDGKDAEPITREQIIEAVKSMPDVLAVIVKGYLEANPPAAGKDGRDGVDGKDGVGLSGALIDKSGDLVVTLSDGTMRQLGPVIGKDGAPGEPGRDGLGFEDFEEIYDGERTIIHRYKRGDVVREFTHTIPAVIYRDVWREGSQYAKGDAATWSSSLWIAKQTTTDKPGTSEAWTLAVKRGGEGKQGKTGAQGPQGPRGADGKDGVTQWK
jgi:hypothetical protein